MRSLGDRATNPELSSPFITASLELGGCDAAYVHADLGTQPERLASAVDFDMFLKLKNCLR